MNTSISSRRAWLRAAACTVALCGSFASVHAQTYPAKPIKLVVPFPAGGATDVLARVIGEKMAASMGQPVIVDNRAGAAGIIGTDAVAKAAPDGYTIVLSLSNSPEKALKLRLSIFARLNRWIRILCWPQLRAQVVCCVWENPFHGAA